MKLKSKLILFGAFVAATFCANGQTITPFNTQVNSSGTEVVTDYLLSFPDGTYEVFTANFGEDVFQIAGSATIPSVWNLPLSSSVTDQSGGGTIPVDPYSFDPKHSFSYGGSFEPQVAPILIWAGGAAVTAGACAAGWYATRRALISSCRDQGKDWDSITVGRCGIAGSSSIDCEDEADEENTNVLSWMQFSQMHLPWTYAIDGYIIDLSIPEDDGF